MIVRHAGMADLDTLIALGREMVDECVNPVPREIHRGAVWARLQATQAAPDMLLAALAIEDDEPLGMITGITGTYGFGVELQAISHIWYVRPSCRNSRAGVALLRHLIKWAHSTGATECLAGVVTGIHPERTEKLLFRMGFELSGKSYVRSLR